MRTILFTAAVVLATATGCATVRTPSVRVDLPDRGRVRTGDFDVRSRDVLAVAVVLVRIDPRGGDCRSARASVERTNSSTEADVLRGAAAPTRVTLYGVDTREDVFVSGICTDEESPVYGLPTTRLRRMNFSASRTIDEAELRFPRPPRGNR